MNVLILLLELLWSAPIKAIEHHGLLVFENVHEGNSTLNDKNKTILLIFGDLMAVESKRKSQAMRVFSQRRNLRANDLYLFDSIQFADYGIKLQGIIGFIQDRDLKNYFYEHTVLGPRPLYPFSCRGPLAHRGSLKICLSPNYQQRTNGNHDSNNTEDTQNKIREIFRRNEAIEVRWRFMGVLIGLPGGVCLFCYIEFVYVERIHVNRIVLWCLRVSSVLMMGLGFFSGLLPIYWDYDATYGKQKKAFHGCDNVTQKLLTTPYYCNTLIAIGRAHMANVLSIDKQVAIISGLAEGSGIRQIERITGVHRDTIMRLAVRVGKGCASLMDSKMRDLPCENLQFDELWGFIGKKQKHVQPEDSSDYGDVWTFCAIDSDTKLVPSFKVGKRDMTTANAFVSDVASRMRNRIQVSTDGLPGYVEAVEKAFGMNVDYAQVIKIFESEAADAEVIRMDKRTFTGHPDLSLASTSHVERLNGTTRLHMRRLTRLTYAFSKKLENFEAAVALHFTYYNFVKRHNTLRATPAMAAGIERGFWTVGDLIEATA